MKRRNTIYTAFDVRVCLIGAICLLGLAGCWSSSNFLDYSYSTAEFHKALNEEKTVLISIGADFDLLWKMKNSELKESDTWRHFFDARDFRFFIYNRSTETYHKELSDLKNGAGSGLLAVYDKRIGDRPLTTHAWPAQPQDFDELISFLGSEINQREICLTDEFIFTSSKDVTFIRGIPGGARGPDPNFEN
jgi:hypothetical protein